MTVVSMLYAQMLAVQAAEGIEQIECECSKADALVKTAAEIRNIERMNMDKARMLDDMGAKPSAIMPLLGAARADSDACA